MLSSGSGGTRVGMICITSSSIRFTELVSFSQNLPHTQPNTARLEELVSINTRNRLVIEDNEPIARCPALTTITGSTISIVRPIWKHMEIVTLLGSNVHSRNCLHTI